MKNRRSSAFPEKKVKVIYIAGMGHSGSTLLDLLLGSAPNALGLGELCNFGFFCDNVQQFVNKKNELEGTSLKTFWEPIIKKQQVLLEKKKTGIIRKKLLRVFLSSGKQYRIDDDELFQSIQSQASRLRTDENLIYIDSSKDVMRLIDLSRTKSIDLHVIHLMRNPNGVLYSLQRKGATFLPPVVQWIFVNLFIHFYLKFRLSKKKWTTIWYEDLAKDPRYYLRKINAMFGLKTDPDNFVSDTASRISYRFSGNRMGEQEFHGIMPDEEWKKKLAFSKQLFVNLVTLVPKMLLKV